MNVLEKLKSEFPDIDIKKGLSYCVGDEEFYAELVCDFAEPVRREEIEAAYKNRDWENYTVKIHAIKGNARTLGFVELGDIAESLQKASEKADVDFIEKNHERAVALLKKLEACFA